MKILQRMCAFTLTCLMLAGLSACQLNAQGAASDPAASAGDVSAGNTSAPVSEPMDLSAITDPYLATAGIAADTVVATVGDVNITAGQVLYHAASMTDGYLEYYSYYYGIQELPWDAEGEQMTLQQSIMADALNTAALYAILPGLASQENISLDHDEVDGIMVVLDQLKESYGSDQAVTYALWQEPMTPEMYRALVESGVYYSQIQDKYYGENGLIQPAEEEILAFAADQLGYYKAKHILFKTVDTTQTGADGAFLPLEDSVIAEKKAQAESVLAQLQAASDVEPLFDQLMAEYSEDRNGDAVNGLEGYVAAPGQMVSAFEQGTKALENFEVSPIVESEYGYHIILRLPLENSPSYTQAYIEEQMAQMQQQWLDSSIIEKTDRFAALDLPVFYERLDDLRIAVSEKLQEDKARQDAASSSPDAAEGTATP